MAGTKLGAVPHLNRELRKAVHSGEGYETYITIYQYEKGLQDALEQAKLSAEEDIRNFYRDGGQIERQGLNILMTFNGASLFIEYDIQGNVISYTPRPVFRHRRDIQRMMGLFFDTYMLPKYNAMLEKSKDQLEDLDNDRIIRGICEIRDLIRGDRYMTVNAVSGMGTSEEDSTDSLGIFDKGEEGN